MKAQPFNKAGGPRPWRAWYSTPEWKVIRAERLAISPWCVLCRDEGRKTPATVADHIKPHRGNRALFFSLANTQALCAPHHDRDKQREELRGYSTRLSLD